MPIKSEEIMDKSGQINNAYAGGWDTTGIPMRSQMPIYINENINKKWIMGNETNKTQYINNINLTGFFFLMHLLKIWIKVIDLIVIIIKK